MRVLKREKKGREGKKRGEKKLVVVLILVASVVAVDLTPRPKPTIPPKVANRSYGTTDDAPWLNHNRLIQWASCLLPRQPPLTFACSPPS